MEKLVLLSFRGYIGEIESDKTKPQNVSYIYIYTYYFVLHVQRGISSASDCQVLLRNSGVGIAF